MHVQHSRNLATLCCIRSWFVFHFQFFRFTKARVATAVTMRPVFGFPGSQVSAIFKACVSVQALLMAPLSCLDRLLCLKSLYPSLSPLFLALPGPSYLSECVTLTLDLRRGFRSILSFPLVSPHRSGWLDTPSQLSQQCLKPCYLL